jgi:hypothetical protein
MLPEFMFVIGKLSPEIEQDPGNGGINTGFENKNHIKVLPW